MLLSIRINNLRATVAAMAATLLGLWLLAGTSHAAYPGTAGKVAFDRFENGTQYDVFAINSDRSGLLNLTSSAEQEFAASYNGSGNRVAFSRQDPVTSNQDIWVMNADGSGKVNLTNSPAENEQAGPFSPDGKRILYHDSAGGFLDIFVMNADGTGRVNLTNSAGVGDFCPAWTPDGRTIYFAAFTAPGSDAEIFSMKSDGSDRKQLTVNSVRDDCPDVSPDGKQIAFDRDTGTGQHDIFVANLDGSGVVNISNNFADERSPVYSPNGRRIAFSRDTDADNTTDEVFLTDPKGSVPVNLTSSGPADFDFGTDWQPVPVMCGGKRSTIVGSKARDKLRGTPFNDVIFGGGGRDTINGFGGRDIICGGGGKDRLFGGGGRDRLFGGKNRDACFGGTGTDTANGCERAKVNGSKKRKSRKK